ncbi:hypothetical protein [Lysinibacillus sp. NPDC096259]|uniref:hypothetical protein n=1 Tax=Lysinibacillus sp. NPDC096259 TaxID=3390583 RepID=UPI003CFE3D1C
MWAKNPIEHPLPLSDKGYLSVDSTTDINSLSDEYVANMLLKVSNRPTSNFMQMIRIIHPRKTTSNRKGWWKELYANFNPKYVQMAVTILRTYYNFLFRNENKGKGEINSSSTTWFNKRFSINDILYFK